MVSPVPDERDTKRVKRYIPYGLAHQPVDLREGVAKAYTVVKEVNHFWCTFLKKKQELIVSTWWRFPLTGHYRHSADHLRHSHQGARTARHDRGRGWSPPPTATGSGQATHHGHRSHLECLRRNEEPDSPRRATGRITEVETGWRVTWFFFLFLWKPGQSQRPLKVNDWHMLTNLGLDKIIWLWDLACVGFPESYWCLNGFECCPTAH